MIKNIKQDVQQYVRERTAAAAHNTTTTTAAAARERGSDQLLYMEYMIRYKSGRLNYRVLESHISRKFPRLCSHTCSVVIQWVWVRVTLARSQRTASLPPHVCNTYIRVCL